MIALLLKETEALLPYWVAFGVLIAANVAALLWDPGFVLEPLAERFSNGDSNAAILWVLSFLVGHGAVAHELRDGHVEFLDALPTSRLAVFVAKLAACMMPVLMLVGASLVMDLGLVAISRPPASLSPLQPVLVMHLVMLVSGLGGLGTGMLLSWIGPLAWGVLGLTLLLALCAGAFYPPVEGWIPAVGSYGLLEWQDTGARHPVGPPLGILLVGSVGLGVSGLLFLGPGQALTDRGSQAVGVVRLAMVGCLALLAAPFGLLFSVFLVVETFALIGNGVRVLETRDFRVLHVPENAERARDIAGTVDDLSTRVGALVGNPRPLHLDIEVLGAQRNHLGVFTGGKVRVERFADDGTLAHELAHAHAYAIAGDAAWLQQGHTHFFDEGLADWVRARLLGDPLVPDLAGAIHATGQARFEDLVDRERHLRRHDARQAYALGQAFVAALVEVEGEAAPSCLLRALGDVGHREAAGLALWYGLAHRCAVDLDAVQDRWFALMDEVRGRLPPLPRLRVSLPADGVPRLEVRDELGLGYPLHCGFRDRPSAPIDRWMYVEARDGVCEVPLQALSGHSYQYQVGHRLLDRDVLFLEWTDARRP